MGRTEISLPFSGTRLRERRERAGLLQTDLARKATEAGYPVSRSTVSHLETGDRRPLAPVLSALAAALDCEIDDLLDTDTSGEK